MRMQGVSREELRRRVMLEKSTEPPFSGDLLQEAGKGVYRCAGCGKALFISESKDPQLYVRLPEIPIAQIKRITLCAEASPDAAGPLPIELFFLTALYPDSSSFCWAQLGPLRSGKISVPTSDIMGWSGFGTPLTAIRIDPGEKAGATLLLKRLILE